MALLQVAGLRLNCLSTNALQNSCDNSEHDKSGRSNSGNHLS